jgi:hypothetical protein
MQLVRASIVLAISCLYLTYVFQLNDAPFWTAGLSYWLAPYFINALLEHWYVSLGDGNDPSSPPMYFPATGTPGASHGLVLYVPFYVPLRLFLHPFSAYNWTIFLVMLVGSISLCVLLRKLGLSLIESLALAAFFVTSPNVVDEAAST